MRTSFLPFLLIGLTQHLFSGSPVSAEETVAEWLRAPEGFRVTHFAEDSLATNIYSMTTDRLGRIVVAGPGYIRILLDEDGDGKAEKSRLYSEFPKNGAMGLCFDGDDLICVGDRGLLRLRDANRDDRADGPPELILPLKTGGEHDSHAIRKGPDGWWYLVSGNYSGVGSNILASGRSPVKNPSAGVITRISPDFKQREIYAHGMRNTYDFDFDEAGDLFIYDSDGERDVSLPWYEPTRVFRLHPGSHAGWISRSWKRPDIFFDMPTVAARLGRGSPTGVACYRHSQFPAPYRNTVFVLDWTFGRVMAVRRSSRARSVSGFQQELFLAGKGTHGFAPTDACVGADGSLYISVGGRSTRGSVYRIRYVDTGKGDLSPSPPQSPSDCLDVPQPLAAWARALWEPAAKKMGREKMENCIFNASLTIQQRKRAVEVATALFGPLSDSSVRKMHLVESPEILSRIAWSICQQPLEKIQSAVLLKLLNHPQDPVRIAALEELTGNQSIPGHLAGPLVACLESENVHLQKAAASFVASSGFSPEKHLDQDPATFPITLWMARQMGQNRLNRPALEFSLARLRLTSSPAKQLLALRLFQISLGDVGPRQGLPQVFESYEPRQPLPEDLKDEAWEVLKYGLASPNSAVRRETIRCLAICKLVNSQVSQRLLQQIHPDSPAPFDIHVLAALAQVKASPLLDSAAARAELATKVLQVQAKIDRQGLNQDRNWEPRFKEIVRQLVQRDEGLLEQIVKAGVTRPGQAFLFGFMDRQQKRDSIDRYLRALAKNPEFQMDTSTLRLLASTSTPEHWKRIRQSFTAPHLRDTVIELLASKPEGMDRARFVAGLKSSQVKTIRNSAQALLRLSASRSASEQLALATAMSRISPDKEGYAAREWLVRALQRNMGTSFGFVFGSDGYRPQVKTTNRWLEFLSREFPEEAKRRELSNRYHPDRQAERLAEVDWNRGDPSRGASLYTRLSCGNCHGKRNRLGPDLAGVSRRFSRADLYRAIADPGYQVPSRYQTTLFETNDSQFHSGIVIYESVDGVLLRDSNNQTLRLEKKEIARRQKIAKSLMPENLLDEVDSRDLADLFAYLESL
ncbi:MAG: PVC-type heme-binding CxxCH protein [Planctomycetota bacterium]|nr:PVC-type heme-binding CxxCH protein [Planctomycetota bacterium]